LSFCQQLRVKGIIGLASEHLFSFSVRSLLSLTIVVTFNGVFYVLPETGM
jgi:hypothetical protein